MKYLFCAKNVSFYPLVLKDSYVKSGAWPEEGIEVDETIFNTFTGQPPIGKQRGADSTGYPAWVDIPPAAPLTREQQIKADERQKTLLLEKASKAIAPLQDASDLGMATEAERAALLVWKKYRIAVNRIEPAKNAVITWPEVPGVA
ncbi:tail fiber assembly protein [Gibbsiella greigii]